MSPSRKRPVGYAEQRWAELRRLADERKIRTHKGGDPRVTRFMDALLTLTRAQWAEIAYRHTSRPYRMTRARYRIASVTLDLSMGRTTSLSERTYDRNVHDPALAARDRVFPIVDALRGTLPVGDEDVPLRQAARGALIDVTLGLMVYDWLTLTKPDAAAARAVFDPFRGFAPLPDEE